MNVEKKTGIKGKLLMGAVVLAAAGVGTWAVWPAGDSTTAYPLAERLSGSDGALFELSPEDLQAALSRDAEALRLAIAQADSAVAAAEASETMLGHEDLETISRSHRDHIRSLWWLIVEPLLVLDRLKRRYQQWFGIDYLRSPELHAQAYAINYAALLSQVHTGLSLLRLVRGNDRVQALFDEAMPDYGLPRGTFRMLRTKLSRVEEQSLVPVGKAWFDTWMERHLEGDHEELLGLVRRTYPGAREELGPPSAKLVIYKPSGNRSQ